MKKLYLLETNADNMILLTDGTDWYDVTPQNGYWNDEIDICGNDGKEIAARIRQYINSDPDIYDADDIYMDFCSDANILSGYHGFYPQDIECECDTDLTEI